MTERGNPSGGGGKSGETEQSAAHLYTTAPCGKRGRGREEEEGGRESSANKARCINFTATNIRNFGNFVAFERRRGGRFRDPCAAKRFDKFASISLGSPAGRLERAL